MDRSASFAQSPAPVDADGPTVIISQTYLPLDQESLTRLKQELQDFSFIDICANSKLGWLITFANDQRGAKHCRRVFKHVSNRGWQARISELGPYMRSNPASVMDGDNSLGSRNAERKGDQQKRRRLMSSEQEMPAFADTLPLHGYASSIVTGLRPPSYAFSKPKGSFSKGGKKMKTSSTPHSAEQAADRPFELTAPQASVRRVQSANLQSSDDVMTRPVTPMALLLREIMMEPGAPRSWMSQMLVEKIRERHPYYAEVFPQKTLKSNVPAYLSQSPYFQKVQGSTGSVPGHRLSSLWELAPERRKQNTSPASKSAKVLKRDVEAIQDVDSIDTQRVDETYYVKSSFSAQFEICTRRSHVKAWNDLEVLEEACHAGTIYKPGETARILIDDDEDDGDFAQIFALRKTENLGIAAAVLWYKSKSDPFLRKTPGALRDLTNEQGQYLLTSHVDIVSVETFAGLASTEEKARLSTTSVIDMKSRPWKVRASDELHVFWMQQYTNPQHSLDQARTDNMLENRRHSVRSVNDTILVGADDGNIKPAAAAEQHDGAMREETHDLRTEVHQLRAENKALSLKVDHLQKDVKDLQKGSQGMMQLESRVEALEARETQMKDIRD